MMAVMARVQTSNKSPSEVATLSGIERSNFTSVVNGDSTDLYVLTNTNGVDDPYQLRCPNRLGNGA